MNSSVVNLKNASTGGGTPAAVTSGKSMGKEDFMKLLLTQLSAQDPLNPQDSTAFVAQLTQFANLESTNNLGTKLDQLVTISGASNAANAVSLLGKEVRVGGNSLGGPTTAYYELPTAARSVKIEIRDTEDHLVKLIENQPTSAGLHEVKITDLPPGKYTFRVEAINADGKEMNPNLSVADLVKGVSFSNGNPVLLMSSGSELKASEVVEIRQPAAVL